MIERAKSILKSVFGYEQFISLQKNVVEHVLQRRDCLVVMPTGGGKSLCYQVPALLFDGLTVVVSPLISLMKDQVDQLRELGVPVALLNSSLSPQDYRRNVERIEAGRAKLLYAAPETLMKASLQVLLRRVQAACLAIDEAHCISEWGPDFRPEYRRLAEVRALLPDSVCMALTATATPRVREDIRNCLGIDSSSEFIAGFNRENLFIRVAPKDDPIRQTVQFLSQFPNESGIIYCLTRKQVDDLCSALQRRGLQAIPYHAGLSEAERHRNQERFVRDQVPIIVATIAFGMGIDKSNVRFILHYDLPKSIESYYQEIGRAGRDGLRADCLLLLSYGDIYTIRAFIDKKEGNDQRIASLQLKAMLQLAEAEICRRVPLLAYFGEKFPHTGCGMCDNCLAGQRELTDVTIPAQKFLSCVKRTGEIFGAAHIINVLLGSMARKVLQHGHDRLSTHGIGREYSQKQWQQLARQFVHKGLLEQDAQFGSLRLTQQAWQVLRGEEKVFARVSDHCETGLASNGSGQPGPAEFGLELFEKLRRKRRELADEANVPPYVVFSDKTLRQMAVFLPEDLEQMSRIHGVGRAKLEKYGAVFLQIVTDYLRSHPSVTKPPVSVPPLPEKQSYSGRRHILIGEAYNAGQSIPQVAERFGIQQKTVVRHLYTFQQEGFPLRPDGFLPLLNLPQPLLDSALEVFAELGCDYLRPVFEALREQVSFDDLQVIRLFYLSCLPPADGDAADRTDADQCSVQLVCLANSRKYAGRCIAGKQLLPGTIGKWIRPVSHRENGELSLEEIALRRDAYPRLLDILEIPLRRCCPHSYQSENHQLGVGRWRSSGAFPVAQAALLCDDPERLWINGYHSRGGINDRMPEKLVGDTLSSSLLFIRPDELCMSVTPGPRGLRKVRAKFKFKGESYCLTVTDPLMEAAYMEKEVGEYAVECAQAYLTVSIGEPFEGFCYKLAAAALLVD